MTNFTDKQIEDAFARIRVKFEKRNNETGLEILDGYEEQWEATGSLSLRQIGWLENQLDESWKQKAKVATPSGDDDGADPAQEPEIIQFPNIDREIERRVDAVISRKLEEPGKTVVDHKRLDELEEAIDDLKQIVRSMR